MKNFPEYEGPMHLWSRVEPIPGIRTALQALHPTSILALATNAADSAEGDIRTALARCDLSEFFDRIYCFRGLEVRKPHRSFYQAILDDLGLPGHLVFMVGDSFESDVLAANEIGIPAVWFNPGSTEEPSGSTHRTVHDLRDLPTTLQQLGAKI